MKWKDSVDWLFCTDLNAATMSYPERLRLYKIVKKMCPMDRMIDSPVPVWVLNVLLNNEISYRQRVKMILKQHELLTGQSFGVATENDVMRVKKEYGKNG